MTRGASRQAGIPPVQCTATNRRGEPCKNFAQVGRTVCHMHGGNAGQVVRKGEERVTLAQLLQSDPRPLVEVMAEAVHNVDAAMRDAKLRLLEGEEVSVDQLDRMLELSRLSHHLSRTMVETGIFAKVAEAQRAQVGEIGTFISEVLLAVLNALPLTREWREYLLDLADYHLRTIALRAGTRVMEAPSGPPPVPPTPPAGPILTSAGSTTVNAS
jgi:DNA-binding transcriptional ArsR family regulator